MASLTNFDMSSCVYPWKEVSDCSTNYLLTKILNKNYSLYLAFWCWFGVSSVLLSQKCSIVKNIWKALSLNCI